MTESEIFLKMCCKEYSKEKRIANIKTTSIANNKYLNDGILNTNKHLELLDTIIKKINKGEYIKNI